MSITGLTSTGLDRPTFNELVAGINAHLKSVVGPDGTPCFGAETTLDDIEANAGDPLVELVTAFAASKHEIYELLEGLTQNLDPSQANEYFLKTLHACAAGLTLGPDEDIERFRARICDRRVPCVTRIEEALNDLPSVVCSGIVKGPYGDKIAAGETMLVVRGNPTAEELGNAWWKYLPGENLTGDTSYNWDGPDGRCHKLFYQPACRVMFELLIYGEEDPCGDYSLKDAASQIIAAAKIAYGCDFGGTLSGPRLSTLLPIPLPGVAIQTIDIRPRPRQLVGAVNGVKCEDDNAVLVTLDNNEEPEQWTSASVCGCCPGQFWCENAPWLCDYTLKPWEFPDFDIALCQTTSELKC